jgi:large subunit ribosomal protein L32
MAHPKRKISKARAGMRQSHDALTATGLCKCGHCGAWKRPHTVCGECGYYGSKRQVLETAG